MKRNYNVPSEKKARGSGHGIAKLTEQDVITIREWYSVGGWKQKDFAKAFGVSKACIRKILFGVTWRHV